jgi:hypothetical protein
MAPRDGINWLYQAMQLILSHPSRFIAVALLTPISSALLLTLPIWKAMPPMFGGWFSVLATLICYGLPLAIAINLACGFARATSWQRYPSLRQLLVPSVLRVLLKASLFLFALLLQGYLAVYLIHNLINPATITAGTTSGTAFFDPVVGVADTILATQLGMTGALLLVLQFLFAFFVIPLHLFRELSLQECWHLSFLAVYLNPWLVPALGLPGLALLFMAYFSIFSIPAQILALPMPVYLGALLFVAWREVFQGGLEDDKTRTANLARPE